MSHYAHVILIVYIRYIGIQAAGGQKSKTHLELVDWHKT